MSAETAPLPRSPLPLPALTCVFVPTPATPAETVYFNDACETAREAVKGVLDSYQDLLQRLRCLPFAAGAGLGAVAGIQEHVHACEQQAAGGHCHAQGCRCAAHWLPLCPCAPARRSAASCSGVWG